ncbi:MAG TPA: hypothetical protein PKJ02_04435, partial [Candidatus Avimonas sp.]|nr:hypothetical protein [Candidatus Avimonas sp.]
MPQVQVLSLRPAASRRRQVAHSLSWVRFSFLARAEATSFFVSELQQGRTVLNWGCGQKVGLELAPEGAEYVH